jgi:hypothetical protein
MSVEKRIDDLIDAGWHVLDSDFDVTAFRQWRERAVDCLDSLLGPDHTYSRHFRDYVNRQEPKSILAAGGILTAAKETVGREDGGGASGFTLGADRGENEGPVH